MPADQTTPNQITAGQLDLALDVHNGLAKLVAPASPGSIDASSFDPRRNLSLFLIAVCAILSFAIFIAPVIWAQFLGSDVTNLVQIIGGAGLGSSFYALYKASEYIQSGTYDPKYNNTYLIRFGLGILSGLILAYFFRYLSPPSGDVAANSPNARFANIGVSALALVGGFASDAVAQILTRVSETLVTAVSGSDKDKADAATQKALNDTVQKLNDAMSDPDPAKVKANVQAVVKAILTSK